MLALVVILMVFLGKHKHILTCYTHTHRPVFILGLGKFLLLYFFRVPTGLEDVSKYPYLFAELIRRGYSDDDIKKVAGLNLIRVFEGVEQVRYRTWVHFCLY